MQNPTDPQEVPSNATSSVCSDQAHNDDLSLHAVEWSDEDRECQGDSQLREGRKDQDVRGDPEDLDLDDSDNPEEDDEGQDIQESLLSLSGAPAPEFLRLTYHLAVLKKQIYSMHSTSPAHPQEKNKEYQAGYIRIG